MESFEKKMLLIWSVLLVVTSGLMILIFLTGTTSLHFTLIIYLIVGKFLAGFGIPLGISTFVIFILTKFESRFTGEEHRANLRRFLIFIIFILICLLIYQGPYSIYKNIINPGGADNIFDQILYIYGIASLFLTIYIIPLIKKRFFIQITVSEKDVLKKSLKRTVDRLKTWFLTRRKKYAQVELKKQHSLKEHLDELRRHIAIFTLLFLGIGCLIFTPLCAIFICMWIRIYIITDKRPFRFETYLLIIAVVIIMVISLLLPLPFFLQLTNFSAIISNSYYWVVIAQLIGMLTYHILYIKELLKHISPEKGKQQIQELKKTSQGFKKERDDLQQNQKELLKEKKQLEKKVEKSSKEKGSTKSEAV